jgi:hypothetical protein
VCEVPIDWRYVKGSRIHPFRDTFAMVGELLAIRANSWRGRYAERALEPAAWQNRRDSAMTLVEAASAD